MQDIGAESLGRVACPSLQALYIMAEAKPTVCIDFNIISYSLLKEILLTYSLDTSQIYIVIERVRF